MVNGGFERPSEQADPVPSWRNTAGPIDVFRNVAGLTAAEGTSIIEIDSSTAKDRIEQAVATTAGRTYVLQEMTGPAGGVWQMLGSQVAGPDGTVEFAVLPPGSALRLYRVILP